MASNNEYKRYFIILQEDDKGYEMSPGKIPTGYVKIEVKNKKVKLNAFIQNVKIVDSIEYRLILVASGKKLAVDIGKIMIDNSGRGEISHEIESDNVLKSGLNVADFTVAAVTSGASVPLSGYTGRDKLEWKGKYDIINKPREQVVPRIDKKITVEEIVPEVPQLIIPIEPVIVPKPEIIPEPVASPPLVVPAKPEPIPVVPVVDLPVKEPEVPKPEIIMQKPVIEHTHIHQSKVEVEIVMPQCPPMAPLEEPCEIEKEKVQYEDIKQYYCDDEEDEDSDSDSDSDCDDKHHHHEYHKEREGYYDSDMYSKLRKLFRRLRKYEPFEDEEGYDWFKVGEDIYEINSIAIPYMGYMVPMGYPFMSEGCSMMLDRKDYILGVKYDDNEHHDDKKAIRYILFGVPSIYSKRNEQYYKSRGFMAFKPHKTKGYGYFIMCLDLRSGMLCHMD